MNDVKFRSSENGKKHFPEKCYKIICFKSPGTRDYKVWGVFLHKPDEIFSEFSAIHDEIESETERVAGANKGIVSKPINLKIFSPDVVNLTLVDLPGLTKVPVGDQPADIEEQIRKLVTQYIKNPDSIILAVTAANTDLATSEALKIAKTFDRDGVRTLAVLTKLDLMDEGTNAFDALSGSVIPVKLGIIGVINRSQKGLNENKEMKDQLEMEAKFLSEEYPTLAEKSGTPYLSKALNRLLTIHISKCLPELRQRVLTKITEIEALTESYGKEIVHKDLTVIEIIKKFSSGYATTIEGIRGNADLDDTFGKTRLYEILHGEFEKVLKAIPPVGALDADEITPWLEAFGPRPKLYDVKVFDFAFEKIVKEQIKELRDPTLNCLDLAYQELLKNIHGCGSDVQLELQRFPKLHSKIIEVTTKLLRQQLEVAKQRVHDAVAIEITYINKEHPDFDRKAALELKDLPESNDLDSDEDQIAVPFGDPRKFTFNLDKKKTNSTAPGVTSNGVRSNENCRILEKLVTDYYNIVRKTIQDTVPKTIMHFLVNVVKDQVDSELLLHVYKLEEPEMLLVESDDIITKRKQANEMLDVSALIIIIYT